MSPELIYEFSNDPNLLAPYYRIREECYKEVWGLKIFSGAEDEFDRRGHILIVRNGNEVVGGGRLVLRSAFSSNRLPMETENFLLHKVLPLTENENAIFGEIGRIAIIPEYRGKKTAKIGFYLVLQAQLHHCRYLTTVAPKGQAEKYRDIAGQFGVKIQIFEDVAIADHPYYNNIDMKLLLCDLTNIPDVSGFLVTE